jgi:hypothetical protein
MSEPVKQLTPEVLAYLRSQAARGGRASSDKLTPEERRRRASLGGKARAVKLQKIKENEQ